MQVMPTTSSSGDEYTEEVLRRNMRSYIRYYTERLAEKKALKGLIRLPNMPEDISENIVKFVIRNHRNVDCSWAKMMKGKNGDLWSTVENVQECKCFTSSGPSSFGPNKTWDVLYFLDAREWIDDRYVVYRTELNPSHPVWKGLKLSGKQSKRKSGGETFGDQCERGARPHIGWESLYPQIKDHCEVVYTGSFEGIFTKPTSRSAMSSTTGTDTALPANP
jgi:hypothetical protein